MSETQTPRSRRREKNLSRIIDVAMQHIQDAGIEGLSINKLANALDYTPGALYRYFPSKDALVLTLIEEVVSEVSNALALAVEGLEPLAQLRAAVDVWVHFASSSPERFGLISSMFSAPRALMSAEALAEQAVGSMMHGLSPVASAFALAADRKLLTAGDPLDRALILFASVNGLLMLRKQAQRAPGIIHIDRLTANLVETLLSGWMSEPPSPNKATRRTP